MMNTTKRNVILVQLLTPVMALVLLLSGCTSSRQAIKNDARNMAFLYNPSISKINPEYKVYHKTNNFSELMMKINPEELLFNQANDKGIYMARIRLHYQLYRKYGDKLSKNVVDSATYIFEIEMDNARDYFMTTLDVRAKSPHQYMLRVFATDLLRKRMNQCFIEVDKSSTITNQNFNLVNAETGIPFFSNVFNKNDKVEIISNRNSADSITVNYFNNDYDTPSPSYSVTAVEKVKTIPDSVYRVPFEDALHTFPLEGIYHFQLTDTTRKGLTILNFGEYYPKITTATKMAESVVYLANSSEYKELTTARNTKLALDNFWIGVADNTTTAKELIRIYYNRAIFANKYFVSDREGWKTDRGMIYIIYGPPQSLHKAMQSEKWMYYNPKNSQPVEFIFEKRDNFFTRNDYVLKRSDELASYWRRAINSWRSGRVYVFGQ